MPAVEMVTALAETSRELLKFINTKEARKFDDELMELERERYEEKAKADPNMARLDDLEHRIFLLNRRIVAEARRPKTEASS